MLVDHINNAKSWYTKSYPLCEPTLPLYASLSEYYPCFRSRIFENYFAKMKVYNDSSFRSPLRCSVLFFVKYQLLQLID